MFKRTMLTMMSLALLATYGCSGFNELRDVQKGAAIGGAVGIVGGLAVEEVIEGMSAFDAALDGGLGGALVGALVSDYQSDVVADQDHQRELKSIRDELDDCQEALRKCQADSANKQNTIDNLTRKIAELERQLALCLDELKKARGGTRIVLDNDVLFAAGSAVITSAGQKAIDVAAKEIKDNHSGAKLMIEGHTDTDPIVSSPWKSNWELGAGRSLAVLHYLEDKHGIKGASLAASTYSSYRPAVAGDKAANRRTEIVITD